MKFRYKQTALPGLVLLCGMGIVGQQAMSGPTTDKSAQAKAGATHLATLLTQRRDLLQQIEQRYEAQYKAGQATTEEVERAGIAVIQADLELSHTRKERIALRQKWVDKARELEKRAEIQHNAGTITPVDYTAAQLARIEAEIAMEREKSSR